MARKRRRCGIYIDGSNLYNRLTDAGIGETLRFDYAGFIAELAEKLDVVKVGYYVGQLEREEGDERSEKLFRNQQRLFSWLRQTIPMIQIERGRIVRRGRTFQEKGVDVKLAIDMVTDALLEKIDVAILVSSDTDLLPAVQAVRLKRVHVRYVGLDARPSQALVRLTEPVLLTKEQLLRFEAQPEKPIAVVAKKVAVPVPKPTPTRRRRTRARKPRAVAAPAPPVIAPVAAPVAVKPHKKTRRGRRGGRRHRRPTKT